mgnify:CR=1 FL=1
MGLKIDAKDFLTNMSAIKQRSMFAAEKVGQNAAARMEGEAKRNAGWTDRTGQSVFAPAGRIPSRRPSGLRKTMS